MDQKIGAPPLLTFAQSQPGRCMRHPASSSFDFVRSRFWIDTDPKEMEAISLGTPCKVVRVLQSDRFSIIFLGWVLGWHAGFVRLPMAKIERCGRILVCQLTHIVVRNAGTFADILALPTLGGMSQRSTLTLVGRDRDLRGLERCHSAG